MIGYWPGGPGGAGFRREGQHASQVGRAIAVDKAAELGREGGVRLTRDLAGIVGRHRQRGRQDVDRRGGEPRVVIVRGRDREGQDLPGAGGQDGSRRRIKAHRAGRCQAVGETRRTASDATSCPVISGVLAASGVP